MKRFRYLVFITLCTFITICIPQFFFQIQDHMQLITQKNDSKNEALYKKYPVIAAVYADSYSDVVNSKKYDITLQATYDKNSQKILRNAIDKCEAQLTELVKKQVLTEDLLMHVHQINYGTMDDPAQTQAASFTLEQIHSIHAGYVRSQNLTYLKQVNKISNITIRNEHVEKIDKEVCKKIALKMIAYLDLDKIEDWTYIDNGYESYQAKMKILCQVIAHQEGEYQELQIVALPLALQYENVWITRLERD